MNVDDIRKVLDLVREHDLAEFELEQDGLKVRVRKAGHDVQIVAPAPIAMPPAPAAVPTAVPSPAAAAAAAEPSPEVDLGIVKSPIVGTFYRAPEPGAPNFVEVGTQVRKGQVLCIIEAMKLMNEINAECDGEVVKVYVENGQAVQYGERLFGIRPAR